MSSFLHSGDLGDIVYSMPLLKAIGGKHIMRLADRTKVAPFSQPIVRRAHLLIPLFESQSYIEKIECSEENVDVDLSKFRAFHRPTITLAAAQADYYTSIVNRSAGRVGDEPWITGITPSEVTKGRILVARSQRYNNQNFPWKQIVEHYGSRLMFIGLPVEHMVFQSRFGTVEHLKTENFLQLAEFIAGAELFIGNQSSPMSVAIGVGGPVIQEVCIEQPDCIFTRSNIKYVGDGVVELPDIGGSGTLKLAGPVEQTDMRIEEVASHFMVPPGEWQYPNLPAHSHFKVVQDMVQKLEDCSSSEARSKLALYNLSRLPEYFHGHHNNPRGLFDQAMKKAFP